jgi:1,4-alpha-glucan branching enzyme
MPPACAPIPTGYFALLLHAHLPFVHHPEHPRFLEEDWLFEALSETYLPLLNVLDGLRDDGVPFRLNLSFSPTLLSMLANPLLQQRYVHYLDARLQALQGERRRTRHDPPAYALAVFYSERYEKLRQRFVERDKQDVIQAFHRHQASGCLEILTSGATHGYFPLLATHPENLYAQVSMAVRTHTRFFGRPPRGMWLPECAYLPGVDALLAEFGIDYFILDTHGVLHAEPRPKYGVHRPLRTPGGPAAFGRDYETSKQVWSGEEGYPGNFFYREFYRDAGFDIDASHLHPLRHAGEAGYTGLKYHRITGKGRHKEPYQPEWARQQAALHAEDFLQQRRRQLQWLSTRLDKPPIIVAPYDAELFGHWWFEGPQWIDFVARKLHAEAGGLQAITLPAYLDHCGELQTAQPVESSWGAGGFHEVWLNQSNDWIYPYLQQASQRMLDLVSRHPHAAGTLRLALDQAARELLLAQASDWAFILHSATAMDYAKSRFQQHIHRFNRLANMIEAERVDENYLGMVTSRDNLFPDMDYRIFQRRPWLGDNSDKH